MMPEGIACQGDVAEEAGGSKPSEVAEEARGMRRLLLTKAGKVPCSRVFLLYKLLLYIIAFVPPEGASLTMGRPWP